MLYVHQFALYAHVLLGAIAMPLFWVPIIARKGGQLHNIAGSWFVRCMWTVSISGLVMSCIVWWDPVAIRLPGEAISAERAQGIIERQRIFSEFLMMLSLLVLVSVKQATLALRARDNRRIMQRWHHLIWIGALLASSTLIAVKGILYQQVLLMIFGPLGIFSAVGALNYIFKKNLKRREWIIEHFTSIIGSGIGVYTAFFAFGGRAYLQELLPGMLQVLPWVLPGIVGSIAIAVFKPRFQKRFNVRTDKKTEKDISRHSLRQTA